MTSVVLVKTSTSTLAQFPLSIVPRCLRKGRNRLFSGHQLSKCFLSYLSYKVNVQFQTGPIFSALAQIVSKSISQSRALLLPWGVKVCAACLAISVIDLEGRKDIFAVHSSICQHTVSSTLPFLVPSTLCGPVPATRVFGLNVSSPRIHA